MNNKDGRSNPKDFSSASASVAASLSNPYHTTQPKFKRRQLASIDGILAAVLKKNNLDFKLARYEFVLHWAEIVGPEIAKRTRAECIRAGILIVAVNNSVWAQELSFNKTMILKRLKEKLSQPDCVKDISFYVSKDFS